MLISEADPRAETYVASFRQRLQELGWVDGHNVLLDIRWAAGESANFRRHAADLAALAPDVVLAAGAPPVIALREVSSTIPIVFVAVTDPVGSGIAASLARPRGNATGFTLFEFSIAAIMAGAAQGDRTRGEARCGSARPDEPHRDRPICRHPDRCADGRGAERHWHAEERRDRAG